MAKKSELEQRIKDLEYTVNCLRELVFELMRKTTNAAKCLVGNDEYIAKKNKNG